MTIKLTLTAFIAVLGLTLQGMGEDQSLLFPQADNEFADAEVRRLAAIQANPGVQGETEVRAANAKIAAMGANAVPSLIVLLKQAANRDPRVLNPSNANLNFTSEVRCLASDLGEIGDRRAIPVLSALVKFEYPKADQITHPLGELLSHSTDEELLRDSESEDPVIARMAKRILENPASYGVVRRKSRGDASPK